MHRRLIAGRLIATLSLLLLCALPVNGQEWARKMFETTSHDFGQVARGAKAEFAFTLKNIYLEDVHIAGVRSSCGCTTPRVTKDTLKTYETAGIVAAFDTTRFLGSKNATITVTIDQPYYAEVQLQVNGYIRTDIQLEPGEVDFGTVMAGQPAERTVRISHSSNSSWAITDIRSSNPHLLAEIKPAARSASQAAFEVTVRLKEDAPVGYVRDQIYVVTNEGTAQIPVEIRGRVQSEISVSPTSLVLGVVRPGETVTKKLIVRAPRPFHIVNIKCDDDCFEFSVSNDEKKLHLVPVTFVAGDKPGKIAQKILIETDLSPGETTELVAYAQVEDNAGAE